MLRTKPTNTLLPWGLNMDTVPGASAQCTGSAFSVWFPLRPSGTGLSSSSWKREKKTVCLQVKGMGSLLHHLLGSGLVGSHWPLMLAYHRRVAVFQAHPSSRAAPCASLLALLGLAFWGRQWGLSLPQPRSLAATLSRLTLPGPAVPTSAPLPAHERA